MVVEELVIRVPKKIVSILKIFNIWNITMNKEYKQQLRESSGNINININNKLTSFLYELMRDHLPAGKIQEIMQNSAVSDCQYTNGWLALYAEYIANQLTTNEPENKLSKTKLPTQKELMDNLKNSIRKLAEDKYECIDLGEGCYTVREKK